MTEGSLLERVVWNSLSVCNWFFPSTLGTLLPASISRSSENLVQDWHVSFPGPIKPLFHTQCLSESKRKKDGGDSLKGFYNKTQTKQTIERHQWRAEMKSLDSIGNTLTSVPNVRYCNWLVNGDLNKALIYRSIKAVNTLWILIRRQLHSRVSADSMSLGSLCRGYKKSSGTLLLCQEAQRHLVLTLILAWPSLLSLSLSLQGSSLWTCIYLQFDLPWTHPWLLLYFWATGIESSGSGVLWTIIALCW